MTDGDPSHNDQKSRPSKNLSESENRVVDGIVDGTKSIKSAVDTTVFGTIKGIVKGGIIGLKGVFSAGKTVTKETVKGMSDGIQDAKGESSSIKGTGVAVKNTAQGVTKGVVKGTSVLVDTVVESAKTLVSETTKGIKNTTTDLSDSKDKITKPSKE